MTRPAYVGVATVLVEVVVVIAAPVGRSVAESSGLVRWVKSESDCVGIATLNPKMGEIFSGQL